MNRTEEENKQLEAFYDSLSEEEKKEVMEILEQMEAQFYRGLRRVRYIGLATIIIVATSLVSLVLRFCTTWGTALNIVDGSVCLASSGLSYWAFITMERRWKLIPITLLILTMFNIGMALNTWGVF